MKALIFHGTLGSPQGNWFSWLKNELIKKGWDADAPAFPTPEGQSLDSWFKTLKQIKDYQNTDVLIGHSLGPTFILKVLEQELIKPKQVFLVSSVVKKIDIEEYDTLNNSFIKDGFDWDKIKQSCPSIKIIHGDNDPYVPLEHAKYISENLGAPLDIIKNGGHLNSENGYTEFPYLLDQIND